jgi:hypothetical protein
MEILVADEPRAFTKDARSFSLFIQHLKQAENPSSLERSGVLHAVEFFRQCLFEAHVLEYQRVIKLVL